MIYIRRFLPLDLEQVLPMAAAFHAESPVWSGTPFNLDKVTAMLESTRVNPDWYLPLAIDDGDRIVGFAMVTVQPMYFSDDLELLDLAVYVSPNARGARAFLKLMEAIEVWGRSMGATDARLGITTGIRHNQALSAYGKLGYIPIGTHVWKAL